MIATKILDINSEIEATKHFSKDNKALHDNETKKKNFNRYNPLIYGSDFLNEHLYI